MIDLMRHNGFVCSHKSDGSLEYGDFCGCKEKWIARYTLPHAGRYYPCRCGRVVNIASLGRFISIPDCRQHSSVYDGLSPATGIAIDIARITGMHVCNIIHGKFYSPIGAKPASQIYFRTKFRADADEFYGEDYFFIHGGNSSTDFMFMRHYLKWVSENRNGKLLLCPECMEKWNKCDIDEFEQCYIEEFNQCPHAQREFNSKPKTKCERELEWLKKSRKIVKSVKKSLKQSNPLEALSLRREELKRAGILPTS